MKKAFLTYLDSFADSNYHPVNSYLHNDLMKYGPKKIKNTLIFLVEIELASFLNDSHLTLNNALSEERQTNISSIENATLYAKITDKGRYILQVIEKEKNEKPL